jgi:hypothetical protein
VHSRPTYREALGGERKDIAAEFCSRANTRSPNEYHGSKGAE